MQSITTWRQTLLDRFFIVVATGGFAGYAGIAPGTVGSFVGLLLYLPLTSTPHLVSIIAAGTLFVVGVLAASRVEEMWKIKDPKPVVIDEIAGMWIALLLVPNQVVYFVAAFLLFRLFDILKPFPAKQSECLPGGWGIMVDDAVAGLYAGVLLHIVVLVRGWLA